MDQAHFRPADGGRSPDSRVAVIGAGCSGLVTLKVLGERGIACRAFELGREVGGLWDQNNTNGLSAAYDSLRINTSRQAMQFSDFPMDKTYGDYPRHPEVARYFRDYATHFGLRDRISFETEVRKVSPREDGGYVLELAAAGGVERREHFDAVVVANGHHFAPAFPDPPAGGAFSGVSLHSHEYKSPTVPHDLLGKRVVVVGMGNSAVDIASELATAGCHVLLSARRGVWVIPRYLLGKPVDQGTLIPHSLPPKLRRRIVTFAFKRLVGRMSDFGLPEPDHLIGEAHPTLSDELPELVRSGKIFMRPSISRLQGRVVHFEDGQRDDADAIVYCTGYEVRFPFLDPAHVEVRDNHLPLFLRIFHPRHRRLFFIGLAQPHGAIMPVAEAQARLLAAHLDGAYALPDDDEITTSLQQEAERLKARYVTSKRHTMQLDPELYGKALLREERAGNCRSRRGVGQAFPGWTSPAGRRAKRDTPEQDAACRGNRRVPRESQP